MLFEKNMCIDFANIRPIFLKMVLEGDERKIKFISKKIQTQTLYLHQEL